MNDGKRLEKIVRLIQETLKDVPQTEIFSNYKIKNIAGRKKEIDILIVTTVNGMSIKIAIECKDYSKPVPAEKIDAFNSKCQMIKGISKMVFVSSSGYQAGAIDSANHYDIKLYNIDEISQSIISLWFPITKLKTNYTLTFPIKITIDGEIEDLNYDLNEKEPIVYFYDNSPPCSISEFTLNAISTEKGKREIWICAIMNAMREGSVEKAILLPVKITTNYIYVLAKDGKQFRVLEIEANIKIWFVQFPIKDMEAHSYVDDMGNIEANSLEIPVGKSEKANIVFAKNNKMSFFHSDSKGYVFELKTQAKYDPKTAQFIFSNDDDISLD